MDLVFIRRCEYLIYTTIPSYPPNVAGNKSEILYGIEEAVGRGVYFMSNVKERMDICFDHSAPSIVVEIEEYRNGYIDIRRRGGKIRAFTEITKDNIAHCKELIKLVDELRHLDGVKGGIAISETEYMATTVLKEAKPLTQVIYSNVREVVEQGQYIFDTLWNTATPAEQKIREIEEGTIHYESKVLENHDEIYKQIVHLAETSTELSIVSSFGGMQLIYNNFFDLYKKIMDKYRKGEGKGIRWVCSIDAESIDLVKIFLNLGMQLRHVRSLTPMSFAIGDKELNATVENMEGGKMVRTLLTSNEPIYVKHFSSIFEELWKNGIEASDRIRDIEQGVDQANIENISNPKEGIKRAWSIVKSAKEEVLIMFSSANAVRRQKEMGGLQLLKEASEERNVKVRVLIPADEDITSTTIEEAKSMYPQVDIRIIDKSLQTRITIVLVDKKECVIVELKDDTEDNSYHASGLTTYSNSKSIVSSFGGMQLVYNNFFDLYKKILDKYRKGEGKGIRWVCSIDAESIDLVKIFLNLGMQLRHVKSLTPMSFAIGDRELNATVESMKGGKMVRTLLTSNEPIYIKHFSSIFEELWKNGIDASDRIRDIEQGVDQANIENISNPKEGIKRAWSIVKSAKEEV
ncbi:MAG TPA: hypothetical protein VE226_05125, partial [Nitrososphaeraceae archaeon]|nr:hypothetical protein [Nitrososphaeraceae archaeon]